MAVHGSQHTVRTSDKKILHRKLISTTLKFQRSPKKDVSPKNHKLRGLGGEYMSASGKTKKTEEEGTISASKPKVRKVESIEDNSDFECYKKSDGKPIHVDIDKEVIEGGPALALLRNNSEEKEINVNCETRGRGTVILADAFLTEHLNPLTNWVVYHFCGTKTYCFILTGPNQKEQPKPRLMTMEEMDSDEDHDPINDK